MFGAIFPTIKKERALVIESEVDQHITKYLNENRDDMAYSELVEGARKPYKGVEREFATFVVGMAIGGLNLMEKMHSKGKLIMEKLQTVLGAVDEKKGLTVDAQQKGVIN